MSDRAVIVIPVYKPEPNEYEVISFLQVLKVLKEYAIILAVPQELNIENYRKYSDRSHKEIGVEYFDKSYFKGIDGYNKLMLSLEFYERFMKYEYILIYQLDCFVFRNELKEWIQKGYDYIGAPWLHNDRRTWWTLKNRIKYIFKYYYRRFTNKENTINLGFYKVGNGGLSLRKTQTFCNVIKKFEKNKRIERYRFADGNYLYAEDVFWGCEVNRYYPYLKIPSYKEALGFSFDMNPSLSYELNNNKIPFGCHAWYRYEIEFWKPFIEKEGYVLGESSGNHSISVL